MGNNLGVEYVIYWREGNIKSFIDKVKVGVNWEGECF